MTEEKGGARTKGTMTSTINPSGNKAGNAECLHGDWLNVMCRRRGKTINKSVTNNGRDNVASTAKNAFVVLRDVGNDEPV
ncbi:hypothetical protein SESBI_36662 [Sesbania bispinosa]|nr:hypothetical protein SESBI_36662 [Sesbania bispinosa]